jgi:peptidoglycan/xylan/chitin deacetylase (PgdA/CDA1 family)
MLRSLVKTGTAYALNWSGADKAIRALSGSRYLPLVIGYHQVVEQFPSSYRRLNPAMLISRRMLEHHLDWIGRRFRFVSLDELGARLEEGSPFDEPVAAVTFDDGYRDVYDNAFPVLKHKGIPAAFFVVTDLIGTSRMQIYDKLHLLLARAYPAGRSAPDALALRLRGLGIELPETCKASFMEWSPVQAMVMLLDGLPQADLHRVIAALEAEAGVVDRAPDDLLPASWDMLAEMQRAGMTIGSHTKSHALLTNEPLPKVYEEIRGSRQVLERKLGVPIEHVAYPYGRFNAAVVAAAAVSGYRTGYTTCLHRDPGYPLLTIPRILLWENSCLDVLGRFSSAIMSCQVHRVFDFVTSCRLEHGGPRPPSWSWEESAPNYV